VVVAVAVVNPLFALNARFARFVPARHRGRCKSEHLCCRRTDTPRQPYAAEVVDLTSTEIRTHPFQGPSRRFRSSRLLRLQGDKVEYVIDQGHSGAADKNSELEIPTGQGRTREVGAADVG